MRVEAAQIMRDAYCDLVRDESTQWRFSDIDERAARVTPGYDDTIVRSPEQDALGVVACAVGMMRYVFSDSLLLEHNLDISVRYHMAGILFSLYKVKTEDSWSSGRSMTMHVLERFLHPHELDAGWRHSHHVCSHHQRIAWAAEADLVINHPFAALVDHGVHGHFEVALAQLLRHGAITQQQAVIGVSLVGFYLHAAAFNARRDVIEELARDSSVEEVGAALAYLVVVSQRLCHGPVDAALDLSAVSGVWHFARSALREAAWALVVNAETVVRKRERDGAYACPGSRVYCYASPAVLTMLKAVFVTPGGLIEGA